MGLYSSFLMGSFDENSNKFQTVCKAMYGLNEEEIKDLSERLSMNEFDGECPNWLNVKKILEPQYIVKDPMRSSPIFEIKEFEFIEVKKGKERYTATDRDGVGLTLRFPKITKMKDIKCKDATNLNRLRDLVEIWRKDKNEKNDKKEEKEKNKNIKKKKRNKVEKEKKKEIEKERKKQEKENKKKEKERKKKLEKKKK